MGTSPNYHQSPSDNTILNRLESIQDNLSSLAKQQALSRGRSPAGRQDSTFHAPDTSNISQNNNNMIYYFQAVMDKLEKANRGRETEEIEREERERIKQLEAKVSMLTDALERSRVDQLKSLANDALENTMRPVLVRNHPLQFPPRYQKYLGQRRNWCGSLIINLMNNLTHEYNRHHQYQQIILHHSKCFPMNLRRMIPRNYWMPLKLKNKHSVKTSNAIHHKSFP
ncbi:hypothetical protein BDR26DRAFT_664909 [Obelidium mucronatum]|nr:hypothetical protein BDR26DRAFT_664909 [Obelidium mucronatum]